VKPWPGGKKRRGGRASHPMELSGDWVVSPPVCATRLSLIARGCLMGAPPRSQPWASAVTLPHRRNRLSARRMAIWDTFCERLLRRYVDRALMRSAWLDVTPIIPATACHQRNCVERYSRSKSGRSISHTLSRIKSGGGAAYLLSVAGLIACKDVSFYAAFSCPWTPPSTFCKLLEIERHKFQHF
jgi:hypothetical protein